jgi:hypothetical protein
VEESIPLIRTYGRNKIPVPQGDEETRAQHGKHWNKGLGTHSTKCFQVQNSNHDLRNNQSTRPMKKETANQQNPKLSHKSLRPAPYLQEAVLLGCSAVGCTNIPLMNHLFFPLTPLGRLFYQPDAPKSTDIFGQKQI